MSVEGGGGGESLVNDPPEKSIYVGGIQKRDARDPKFV